MKVGFFVLSFLFLNTNVLAAEPKPLLEATMDADVMVLSLPIIEVQNALPSYLELVPQGLTKHGTHPIFLFYAKQTDLKFIGTPAGSGMNYNEAITYIPYVRVKGEPLVFNYMAQLHLDDLLPIYYGLRMYGYMKDLAKIEHLDQLFIAHDPLTGQVLFDQTMVPLREWNKERFAKNWSILTEIFARPTISNLNGNLICSVVHFQHLSAEPIQSYVELGAGGVPGLGGAQKDKILVVSGLDDIYFEGGVRSKSTYTLSAPVPADDCIYPNGKN